ncbi:hypothetical protein OIU76_022159 [Salix suchowensis]|nr:hypothetical protein OIU76_022159 [Salix suchowensis]
MGAKSVLINSLPFAAMVMVECLDVGLTTLSKAAMSKGMSRFVFVVYSNALATLILLPCVIFHRAKRPPVTFSLLCKFFLLSLVGITLMQNCVFAGVSYSSPTLASAMGQLIPAFTFLLAVIFRMEKLDWRCSRNWIKIMGTLLSISGALIITLYKGPAVGAIATQSNPVPTPSSIMATTNSWVIGGPLPCYCRFMRFNIYYFSGSSFKGVPFRDGHGLLLLLLWDHSNFNSFLDRREEPKFLETET